VSIAAANGLAVVWVVEDVSPPQPGNVALAVTAAAAFKT